MIFEAIEAKVRAAFQPSHLELENESHTHHRGGDETHFRLVVVSAAFEGVSRVDRQRRVYALLDEERAAGLHALAMWTYTPAEWAKMGPHVDLDSPSCAGQTPAKPS
ncbi:MAG: BolA family transcriptional regulator [Bdellovibrionaceae bacterium]|nr:BolA family transcriptional regulator [Pseudobdellovibrionaceae bacterium]